MSSRAFPMYVVLPAVYVVFRVGSFTNESTRWTDTPGYERVAALDVWSWRFFAGERGFTVPVLYKIFGSTESRAIAQLVLSTIAWLILAAALARSIRTGWLRPIVFALVLAFSLTTEVIMWDTLLLSESLTLSLTALVIAGWVTLASRPRRSWAIVVLALSVLWAFARDLNAYVVLFAGLLVALTLVRPHHRQLKAALAVGLCAIFAVTYASADVGKRWLQPLRDIVQYKVITHTSMRSFFEQHGLDLQTNWPVSPWLYDHGRSTYASYLLHHPGYALATPFQPQRTKGVEPWPDSNVQSLLAPRLTPYNDNAADRRLPLPAVAERILYPHGVIPLLIVLVAVLAVALVVGRIAGVDAVWLIPLGILLTTYPHLLLAFHLSGIEIERHAVEATLLLRLALLLLGAFAIDRALLHLRRRHDA